jgi:hypothetical protein
VWELNPIAKVLKPSACEDDPEDIDPDPSACE